MLWAIILAFGLAISAIVAGWRFGGAPERAAAGILAIMLAAPWIVKWLGSKSFSTVDPTAFATDLVALVGFGLIALTANRYWPLWVSSCQLISVAAHAIRWLDVKVEPLVYAVMSGGPSYAISLLVLAGSYNYRRRRKRTPAVQRSQGS